MSDNHIYLDEEEDDTESSLDDSEHATSVIMNPSSTSSTTPFTFSNDDENQTWYDAVEEPLDIDLANHASDHLSPSQRDLIHAIHKAIVQHLKTFQRFDMHVPSSSLPGEDLVPLSLYSPRTEELAELSTDPATGRPRSLFPHEIDEIAATGTFSVPSVRFPGSAHVWRLSGLLQVGREGISAKRRERFGNAWDHLLVSIPDRLVGSEHTRFSVADSLGRIGRVGTQLFDQIVGMPHQVPMLSDAAIADRVERARFLHSLQNHDASPIWTTPEEEALDLLRSREQFSGQSFIDLRLPRELPVRPNFVDLEMPPPPLDLRLFAPKVVHRASDIVKKIIENIWINWRLERDQFVRNAIETQVQQATPSSSSSSSSSSSPSSSSSSTTTTFDEDDVVTSSSSSSSNNHASPSISQAQTEAIISLCLRHLEEMLIQQVLASEALEAVGGADFPAVIAHHLKVISAMTVSNQRLDELRALHHDDARSEALSRWHGASPQRVQRSVNAAMRHFAEHESARLLEYAMVSLELNGLRFSGEGPDRTLTPAYYLLHRNLLFQLQRAPPLRASLSALRVPAREFHFDRTIWLTRNRHALRLADDFQGRPSWQLVDTEPFVVSSDQFGWRLRNLGVRAYVWTSNWLYFWFWTNMVNGPLGLRALFSPRPFPYRLAVSPQGDIIPDLQSRPRATLASRLRTLWDSACLSIRTFESAPDTGILGKSLSRVINRVWNYGIKLGVGSVAVCVAVPLLTAANVALSSAMVAGAVAVVPPAALLKYLLNYLVWDSDNARPGAFAHTLLPVLQLPVRLVAALLRLACSALAGLIGHPLAALLIFALASLAAAGRSVFDLLARGLILRRLARLPQRDTFLARRVAGPGLSFTHFQSITTDQALLMLQIYLEQLHLNTVVQYLQAKIRQPREDYARFVSPLMAPFVDHVGQIGLQRLADTERNLLAKLDLLVRDSNISQNYTRMTRLGLSRVRQTADQLPLTLSQSEALVRDFLTRRVFPLLSSEAQGQLFATLDLPPGDWQGLTAWYLTQIFSRLFLSPLQAGDDSVVLEVTPATKLREFVSMIRHNCPHDDLESIMVKVIHQTNEMATTTQEIFRSRWSSLFIDSSDPLIRQSMPLSRNWVDSLGKLRDDRITQRDH